MIIEFIGPTSAGKTTLAVGVAQRLCQQGLRIEDRSSPSSSVLVSVGNATRTPLMLLPIFSDWRSVSPCLLSGRRHIQRATQSRFWRTLRLAAFVRRVGENSLRSKTSESLFIVDDGLLGLLDLAFSGTRPSQTQLEAFVSKLPLPDTLVSVDAPLETLFERTRARTDPPRELRKLPDKRIRERLSILRQMFDALNEMPLVAPRIINAWNPASSIKDRERHIDRITCEIRMRLEKLHSSSIARIA